jgi:hypothetical protein
LSAKKTKNQNKKKTGMAPQNVAQITWLVLKEWSSNGTNKCLIFGEVDEILAQREERKRGYLDLMPCLGPASHMTCERPWKVFI